jgi:hypothetical protein
MELRLEDRCGPSVLAGGVDGLLIIAAVGGKAGAGGSFPARAICIAAKAVVMWGVFSVTNIGVEE